MKRKDFIEKSLTCGLGAGALMLVGGNNLKAANQDESQECIRYQKFTKGWVKRFVDIVDKKMEKGDGEFLLDQCGRSCFKSNLNPNKPLQKMEVADLVKHLKATWSNEAAEMDGDIIRIKFIVKDQPNKCLCPLVDGFANEISGVYCNCSTGYLKQMFEAYTNKKVNVEIGETIIRGDKVCSFKVSVV